MKCKPRFSISLKKILEEEYQDSLVVQQQQTALIQQAALGSQTAEARIPSCTAAVTQAGKTAELINKVIQTRHSAPSSRKASSGRHPRHHSTSTAPVIQVGP